MKLLWRNDIEMPSFPQIEGEFSTDVLIMIIECREIN